MKNFRCYLTMATSVARQLALWTLDEEVPGSITGIEMNCSKLQLVWMFWVVRRSEFRSSSTDTTGNSVVCEVSLNLSHLAGGGELMTIGCISFFQPT